MRIRGLIQLVAGAIILTLSVTSFSARAQTSPAKGQTAVQETDDEVKVNIYTKFTQTYKTNKPLAYETAKSYLQRYAKDNDQYSKYIQEWVAGYEIELRQDQLRQLVYEDRNFVEAFKLGKQVLADEPDYLDALIALGNAGYLAASARNESFNAEAMAYAKKAIQFIESGKSPDKWAPFKGKDDTLAYLYYTLALLNLKSAPNQAIADVIKAVQFESELKKLAATYYFLAAAYETGPYAKLSADYQKNFAGKEETPESKQAIEKLNQVVDRTIDAYARAVAAAGDDPKNAQNKTTWLNRLTVLYKFRHSDSDAGLKELIASALSKPLPPAP
jgi:tetratricopeptide (TPR) repeat protein